MAAAPSLSKVALLALSVFAVLSLHGAEAQNTTAYQDSSYVPGWGIAILVLISLLVAASLLSCILGPILCGKCGGGSKCCCRN